MKKFLFLLALTACGDSTLTIGGEVIVKHRIDIESLEEYYRPICEAVFNSEADVQECIDGKIRDLLEDLENL